MNKLSYSLLAATGLAMFACSSDEPGANVNNGYADGKVTFAVSAPAGFGSRAVADGLSATELNYAVFDAEGNFLFQADAAASFTNKVTTVQIPLVIGKEYKVAFFAKSPEAPYTITDGVVAMNYNEDKANDDAYDAFYKMESVTVSADMAQQEVTLKRPFAQINIGATDWQIAKKAGYVVESTGLSFTAEVYTSFNLVDGTAAEAAEVTFALATLPDYADETPATLTVEEKAYDYMAMAYVLPAAGDKSLVNTVTFSYEGPEKTYDIEVNAVPVQANHRTNILGRFFSTNVDFDIIIDEDFDDPDHNGPVVPATPETVAEVLKNAEDGATIYLQAGEYTTMPNVGAKSYTLVGLSKEAKIKVDGIPNFGTGEYVFENMTFEYPNDNFKGIQAAQKLTFNNCDITGCNFHYTKVQEYNNCYITTSGANIYPVWLYASTKVDFNNCVFDNPAKGKAILVYGDTHGTVQNVTITGCKFTTAATSGDKCAIEIHSEHDYMGTITISDCTVEGTGWNAENGGLWREVDNSKGENGEPTTNYTVIVDGQTVQTSTKL